MAREYCKDMAVELTLPAYHRSDLIWAQPTFHLSTSRLATQISRSITKNRDAFDAMAATDKVVQVELTLNTGLLLILLVQLMKAVMEDEEIVEGFKMAMDHVS